MDVNVYDFLDGVGYTFEDVWIGPKILLFWYSTDLPFDWMEFDLNMKRDLFLMVLMKVIVSAILRLDLSLLYVLSGLRVVFVSARLRWLLE